MKIENLLFNMDEMQIQRSFLSKTVLETLEKYDESLLIPSNIRKLILDKISHAEMLRNKIMRNALINSIQNIEDIDFLARSLGIDAKDNNRHKLLEINIEKNSSREKNLFTFFEEEHIFINMPNTILDQEIISAERSLFPYQRTAVDEIQAHLDGPKHAALLHMPTGSGKTRTAMRIISNIFINEKNTQVIWIALTEELCEQAISEFKQTWRLIGDREVNILRFFGKHSPNILEKIKNGQDAFIVANMTKLEYVKNEQFLTTLADKIKLVIMDEAHHAIAPTYKQTIEILAKKHHETKLLGLSATPGRTLDENEEDLQLADFFGTNKVMLKINNKNPVRFLIDNKYIAKPDIQIIKYADKLTTIDKKLLATKLDIPQTILEKLGTDIIRNIRIVEIVEKLVNQGQKRIIIFTSSIKSSRDMAMILSAKNLTAYYVDSNIPKQLRKEIIENYKGDTNKEIILCNVNILTAGFDAPKTSAVVIARPTKSLILYSQMIGRALRGEKVNGNKKCYIRVITDKSIIQFKDIASIFEHWEDAWN